MQKAPSVSDLQQPVISAPSACTLDVHSLHVDGIMVETVPLVTTAWGGDNNMSLCSDNAELRGINNSHCLCGTEGCTLPGMQCMPSTASCSALPHGSQHRPSHPVLYHTHSSMQVDPALPLNVVEETVTTPCTKKRVHDEWLQLGQLDDDSHLDAVAAAALREVCPASMSSPLYSMSSQARAI
jgi:hypothetical protein